MNAQEETAQLRQSLKERDAEIERLNKRIGELARERSALMNKSAAAGAAMVSRLVSDDPDAQATLDKSVEAIRNPTAVLDRLYSLLKAPMECGHPLDCLDESTGDCLWCADKWADQEAEITYREAHGIAEVSLQGALAALVKDGHTEHCAHRLSHGDGECECGFKKKQATNDCCEVKALAKFYQSDENEFWRCLSCGCEWPRDVVTRCANCAQNARYLSDDYEPLEKEELDAMQDEAKRGWPGPTRIEPDVGSLEHFSLFIGKEEFKKMVADGQRMSQEFDDATRGQRVILPEDLKRRSR